MNILYKKIINKLLKKKFTISIAESCTGGQVCSEISKISGVSNVFLCGVIAYSNSAKIKILKVDKSKLIKYGAVSKEIAKEMTLNLLKISKSDYCIATTGIAGPTGGTKNKPVGLVFIAIATKNRLLVRKKIFKGNRIFIQKKSTEAVFNILNEFL